LNRFPALTALRFVAALLVFLFHFPPSGAAWDVVAREGHVGVSVFFVLSGFLIALRYAEAMARGEVRLRDYFVRRAARILPLYYAVLFLSLGLTHADVPGLRALLPELTLTQALFGESVHHLVIPTSWSLTVEECFYAAAPLLFLSLAAVSRRFPRRPLAAALVLLTLVVAGLFVFGLGIPGLLDGRGPGFLRAPHEIVLHTAFGRFYDFAVGVMGALVFVSPAGAALRRGVETPRRGLAAAALAAALIVGAQWGMHAAGGIDGPHWARAWAWNLLLAPATALLIVALTAPRNPAARALGASAFVYLGKISYALYLVQLTPLGKGLMYRVLPHGGLGALFLLYAGMTAVSVVLYELIEEPGRRLVLRGAGLDAEADDEPRVPAFVRVAAAIALAVAVTVQCATWVVVSASSEMGPVTLEELEAAAPAVRDVAVLPADAASIARDGALLVGFPRRWLEGWGDDLRAPSALRVFADGQPVPFARREPASPQPAAFFRGPRAELLALRVVTSPHEIVVVRESPLVALRVQAARLLASSPEAPLTALLFAAVLILGLRALGGGAVTPRSATAAAFMVFSTWCALELYRLSWSPALLAAELAVVFGLAVRGHARSRRGPLLPVSAK
jgi:peptidoglycan/LPS O-acetylase OafA/YrhL